MPERYFNPEQIQPIPEAVPESDSKEEKQESKPAISSNSLGRKIRNVALGAMLAAGSLSDEARAERAPTLEPVAVETQQGKSKRKKQTKPQAKQPTKQSKKEVKSLNAFKDKGLKKEIAIVKKFNIPMIDDSVEVKKMWREGKLVRVPDRGKGFFIDPELGTGTVSSPYYPNKELLKLAAPQTAKFIYKLGSDFDARFPGRSLSISSLNRWLARQKQIQGSKNPAAKGDNSSHLRGGSTFDFKKRGLAPQELAFIRKYLLDLEKKNQVQATEERAAFHVLVIPGAVSHAAETPQAREKPRSVESRPRGYPTRQLGGRHLGNEYVIYTGIKEGVAVPEYVDIDFKKQLRVAWDYKLKHHGSHLAGFAKEMVADYISHPVESRRLEEYEGNIDKIISEIRADIDWKKLGIIKGLKNSAQLSLLQAVVQDLNGKDMLAYSLAEFMPARDGTLNAQVMDFLLRNGGQQYAYHMPALHDPLISFGPYQMTDIAMNDVRSHRGALVSAGALKAKKVPQFVKDIRGDDHHRIGFLLAVDNLANLIKKLNPEEQQVFANNWRKHRDQLVEYIAVAHTATSAGLGIGERWVAGGMKGVITDYALKDQIRLRSYALKTRGNLKAIKEWKNFESSPPKKK